LRRSPAARATIAVTDETHRAQARSPRL